MLPGLGGGNVATPSRVEDAMRTESDGTTVRGDGVNGGLSRGRFLAGATAAAASAGPLAGVARATTRRRSAVTLSYMVAAGSPFSEVVVKLIKPVFTKQTGIN